MYTFNKNSKQHYGQHWLQRKKVKLGELRCYAVQLSRVFKLSQKCFFFSTTFNKAIDALFHPRRDGSISCVSASDPSYLPTPDGELNLMH